jgi:hypothetical protein
MSSIGRHAAPRLASRLAMGLLALLVSGCGSGSEDRQGAKPQHVFVIVLENKGFDETFGPSSKAPYLSGELTSRGQLLSRYYGIGHASLDNYVAMVSGQGPNLETQLDCTFYADFLGLPVLDLNGQAIGAGCVYPSIVKTVVNQLENRQLTWKGYMEDMGNAVPAEPPLCRHPSLNTQDHTQAARMGDQYAARHNPFVYFHSIIDDRQNCEAHVVPLEQLPGDLLNDFDTPNYVFITPNLCNDGHDGPCVDKNTGGLVAADGFLQQWVPRILDAPAYQENGLLAILFDEAESGDASACCNEPVGPNAALPGIVGPGGGRTGAVLISPFIRGGSVNDTPYNHYSFLRSVEDLFGLPHLGYAGAAGLKAFGDDVYNGR